jgi:hypothetical protein
LVFDVSPDADFEQGGNGMAQLLDRILRRQFHQWLPGLIGAGVTFGFPFLGGASGVQTQLYEGLGGLMAAGIGPTPAGRVIVAVVYGPQRMFPSMAANLLGSVASSDPQL